MDYEEEEEEAMQQQEEEEEGGQQHPPSPLAQAASPLLASLYTTYRGMYAHLPPSLRPPGMALLEAAGT